MLENEDLKLFEIIYAKNPDKPMSFIQEEVFKAKQALLENSAKLEAEAKAKAESEKKANGKKIVYVELKKSDLVLKSRSEIDEALGNDYVKCCICGRKMNSLGAHLKRFHHVDPKEYIRVCGYPEGTKLMGKNLLQKVRANVEKAQSMRKKASSENK